MTFQMVRVISLLALLFWAIATFAAQYQAEANGIKVIVDSDQKCALKEVTNLPYRATWTEKGKTYEGCAGVYQAMGVVLLYFNDKTVGAIPMSEFVRVTGA